MPPARPDPFAPEADAVIWRYIEDWKFEDLLAPFDEHQEWKPDPPGTVTCYPCYYGNFWFGYPSDLGDDLEGKLPDVNKRPELYLDWAVSFFNLPPDQAAELRKYFRKTDHRRIYKGLENMASLSGASSWSTNEDDPAIWEQFTEGNSVAICSTVGAVRSALANGEHKKPAAQPTACEVRYVDHETYRLPYDGFPGILSLVSSCWSDQSEIRFVAKSAALARLPLKITRRAEFVIGLQPGAAPFTKADFDELFRPPTFEERLAEIYTIFDQAAEAEKARAARGKKGFHLPVRLDGMISKVMVASSSDGDYEQKVRDQLKKVGLGGVPVERSRV